MSDKKDGPDLHVVRGSLENPPPADKPDPVKTSGGNGKSKRRTRGHGEIWRECPVTAIGVQNDTFCYLDILNQVQLVTNHTKDRMRGIFGGRVDLLIKQFPSYNQGAEVPHTFKQEELAAAMQRACSELGVVDLTQRVRETGCWLDETKNLVWHCGDRVLTMDDRGRDVWLQPGLIGEDVYPAKPTAPKPAQANAKDCIKSASELLEMLQTWSWQRPDLDPRLMLGWIGCGLVGGALDWRPMGWVTGDAGMGKSTLKDLIHAVFGGDTGMVEASDASEAGIRQLLMQSTRPVWLDEAEAEADNQALQAVVKLARQAASGGQVLRGSANHQGQTFRVRSAMMFSSILMPPLKDQDLSRLAIFKLKRLSKDAPPPKIDAPHLKGLGARLRRRIWDRWGDWPELLQHYRMALSDAGHSARGQDQFGALLGMADLMLTDDEPSSDFSAELAQALAVDVVRNSADQSHDWERCLGHLLTQQLDVHRGGARYTVGEWIAGAAMWQTRPESLDDAKHCNGTLRRFGMQVIKPGKLAELEIANRHSNLDTLFKDTHWAGGVHRQAIERVPGFYVPSPKNVRTMAGSPVRVTAIPLNSIDWGDDGPETSSLT